MPVPAQGRAPLLLDGDLAGGNRTVCSHERHRHGWAAPHFPPKSAAGERGHSGRATDGNREPVRLSCQGEVPERGSPMNRIVKMTLALAAGGAVVGVGAAYAD